VRLRSAAKLCLVALVVGCGGVTAVQNDLGASVDGAASAEASQGEEDGGTGHTSTDGSAGPETPPAVDAGASCCAACAPSYPCEAVVSCVRAGDAGAYPWQSCHNLLAPGAPLEDLMCVHAACP